MKMSDIQVGEKAVTQRFIGQDVQMRRRLQDLGLIEGTHVECVGISTLGDPKAYLIRGTVIALRKEDAGQVEVRRDA